MSDVVLTAAFVVLLIGSLIVGALPVVAICVVGIALVGRRIRQSHE